MFENPAMTLAIKMASPILVGFVTPFAVDAVKRGSAVVDKAPVYAKQGLAIAIASLGTALTAILGVDVPADLAAWDGEVVKAMVAGFLAIAIKQHKQLKKAKAS
jgi:hypothetical protein